MSEGSARYITRLVPRIAPGQAAGAVAAAVFTAINHVALIRRNHHHVVIKSKGPN